jgi:tetratricopeptide (TPR) repeat protein
VTRKIAGTLTGYEGVVAEADRAKALRKPPANLQAYELYLLAMASKHRETKEDNIKAIELFHRAIEIDPNFTRAYVGLTWALTYEAGTLGYTESFARTASDVLAAAEKAVSLDPYDAEAHLAVAYAYEWQGQQDRANSEFALALEMGPNNADLLMIYAWDCLARCNPDQAVGLVERALRLNPTYPAWYNRPAAQTYYFAGKFDKALEAAQRIQNPQPLEYVLLAAIYGQLGRKDDAAKVVDNIRKLIPAYVAETHSLFFARDDDRMLLVDGVRKAGLPLCAKRSDLKAHPEISPLKECEAERSDS